TCPACGLSSETAPDQEDTDRAAAFETHFDKRVARSNLWYPDTKIPLGDKTSSLIADGINRFCDLFTRRNLLALCLINNEIEKVENNTVRDFLKFTFSSSLKWSSRQSHLRGQIVEGWAMHAYWIYPKSLEINVWNTFGRRFQATLRGKRYGNNHIGSCAVVNSFDQLQRIPLSCLI